MGKAKILRNIEGGLNEMLIIAYIVGGWVPKSPKKCLSNIWMVPLVEQKLTDASKTVNIPILCDVLSHLIGN